jgi:hypothetical protein
MHIHVPNAGQSLCHPAWGGTFMTYHVSGTGSGYGSVNEVHGHEEGPGDWRGSEGARRSGGGGWVSGDRAPALVAQRRHHPLKLR